MKFSIFLNDKQKVRDIWWVIIFYFVLAAITFPVILLSQHFKFDVTMMHQAVIVVMASWICQSFRRKPFSGLVGALKVDWIRNFCIGILMGSALMAIPSFFLFVFTGVRWQIQTMDLQSLLSVTLLFIGVAIAEEFLFRGFAFQRLMCSIGEWPAQIIIAGYFLLTHINNPGMTGNIKIFASINIFLASIMFGLAFIRTKSLSMPLGIHFMANWVQGVALGFGVSGNEETNLLKPVFNGAPDWITGGAFGLEASVPGLISVIITIILLYRWKPGRGPIANT
ncbi:CPBP family intramembrane glutamic endopeptidase [Flavobacterium sp. ZS1P14]|uniref:CPBP family intramembrane glutamic endopeptidase n=1 Tax=Flavobacterium sp. ZS1P14 TaxID=3401729 RepID=UPI003AAAB2CD